MTAKEAESQTATSAASVEPPMTTTLPDFDADESLELAGGDADLQKELIGVFFSEYPPLMAQIDQAIARGDAEALQRAAHTLKGAAAAVAALAATDAAGQLEMLGRSGELAEAPRHHAVLKETIRRLTATRLVE